MRYQTFAKHLSALLIAAGMCAGVHAETLPADYIKWETIPSVIRSDGVETFSIQVHAPGAKTVVIKQITGPVQYITPAPGFAGITLKDDGIGADKVAGDKIFSAGPFKYDTAKAFPANFGNDAKSPAGVYMNVIGTLQITFTDTVNFPTYNSEGKDPAIGLLRKDVPATAITALNANINKASHMVAVRSDRFDADRYMRYNTGTGDATWLTKDLYAVLPDAFDQLLVFPTYVLQGARNTKRGENGISGIHYQVKNEVKGIGQGASDWTASYGSAGRLQAINAFWAYGLQGLLVNHELTHTWEAYLYHTNQLQAGGHWLANNSLGQTWKDNGNGTFTLLCDQPVTKASPMTLYLMGVTASNTVPHVRSLNNNEQFGTGYECGKQITKPFSTISINDLIGYNGVREPAAGVAPKNFSLLFAVQSYNRTLNATEVTFYNTLAKHLAVVDNTATTVSPTSWRPLSSWFTGTTWQTAVSGGSGGDTTPPVITLNGSATMSVAQNSTFTDPGATAQDNLDGNITSSIVKTGSVNTATPGTYVLRYNVKDAAGNAAPEVTRTVTVTSASQACVSATNYQHVAAGRAYKQTVNYVTNAYANGSNTNLGSYGSAFYSPTTVLKETSPGYWTKVTSCL